ncbi:hypothetical protein Tco_0298843 [Tanacetum coccineum]
MRFAPTIPNGSGVTLIPLVTPCLLRPQYCPLCSQAHGFALWPSSEDFPVGHPYQYYFHMSMLNCQFQRTPLAVDNKTRCVIVRRMLTYEPSITPGHCRCGICLGCHRYKKDSGFELTRFLVADYEGCRDSFKSTSDGTQFLEYQLADFFTKALPVDRFNYLVRRLGMRNLSPLDLERLAKSQ